MTNYVVIKIPDKVFPVQVRLKCYCCQERFSGYVKATPIFIHWGNGEFVKFLYLKKKKSVTNLKNKVLTFLLSFCVRITISLFKIKTKSVTNKKI